MICAKVIYIAQSATDELSSSWHEGCLIYGIVQDSMGTQEKQFRAYDKERRETFLQEEEEDHHQSEEQQKQGDPGSRKMEATENRRKQEYERTQEENAR